MTSSKITEVLARQLAAEPEARVAVMVEFSREPVDLDVPTLARMDSTIATGSLTAAEIRTLDARDDVRRIDAVPQVDPT